MEKVLILMSSYNGEKYIRQQIDSILNQKNVEIFLYIRDDGSTDRTIEIIKCYKNQNIVLCPGKNLGAAYGFMELLYAAENIYPEIDYIALADQDDIWLPEKLESGIEFLKKNNADLYCGSLDAFVNNDLNTHYIMSCKSYDGMEGMLRNSVAGCTMIMNRFMLHRICEYHPDYLEMHDSWILRVCKYTGMKAVYDSRMFMRYRLHGDNTCGAAITLKEKLKIHFKNVFCRDAEKVSDTSHEMLAGYKKYMKEKDVQLLTVFDKQSNEKFRKGKLLKMCIESNFSTVSRKADFAFEVIINKI